ncbi:MAG: sugar transferase [Candidatus Cloacimonadota bacterium]|nr:sugar transferase [Candidatus Cloacimonadota bacterium]
MKNQTLSSYFPIIKFISDIFIIGFSFIIGFKIKFQYQFPFSDAQHYEHMYVDIYLNIIWLLIVIWLIAFIISGTYKKRFGPLARINEIRAIFIGIAIATMQTLSFTFIFQSLPQSRYVIVYAALTAFILMFFSRLFLNKLYTFWKKKHSKNKKAVIIGAESMGQSIAEKMLLYPDLGFNYIGTIASHQPEKLNFHLKSSFKLLGSISIYKEVLRENKAEALFVTIDINFNYMDDVISYCKKHDITLRFTPSRYQFNKGTLDFDDMDGVPLINIYRASFDRWKSFIKRLFDIVVSVPLIILLSPVFLIIALIIKFTSPGPIFYKQLRVGRTSEPSFDELQDKHENPSHDETDFPLNTFYVYKYRTMITDAEHDSGPTMTMDVNSNKITPFGAFLRRSSLDELPQLLNIFKGDMSLIGPRPERPYFHQKFVKEISNWDERLVVLPGITGWAQVNGRAALSTEPSEKLTYDLYYIEHWSLMFDLKIIYHTIINVILQRNVY